LGEAKLNVQLPQWLGVIDNETGDTLSEVDLCPADGIAILLGLYLATLDLQSGHANFTLNNLIATFITIDVLQLVGLQSYRTAAVLSAGLLLYDVFWVFGSKAVFGDNVMMTVATSDSFTGPFRLLFPRWETVVDPNLAESGFPFSLLGLGDIAVPGLLVCLMLKLDGKVGADLQGRAMAAGEAFSAAFSAASDEDYASGQVAVDAAEAADSAYDLALSEREYARAATSLDALAEYGTRAYFLATLGGYVGGLGVAFGVNYVTGAGQPALLYLVPFTLLASLGAALKRGEVLRLLSFVDETKRDNFVSLD